LNDEYSVFFKPSYIQIFLYKADSPALVAKDCGNSRGLPDPAYNQRVKINGSGSMLETGSMET
jgi:hypothetical protein